MSDMKFEERLRILDLDGFFKKLTMMDDEEFGDYARLVDAERQQCGASVHPSDS